MAMVMGNCDVGLGKETVMVKGVVMESRWIKRCCKQRLY